MFKKLFTKNPRSCVKCGRKITTGVACPTAHDVKGESISFDAGQRERMMTGRTDRVGQ